MKNSALILVLIFTGTCIFAQKRIDLHQAVKNKNIEVYGRQLTLINEPNYKGIRLSKDYGEGIAWLKGIDFSNGVIEFDLRGEDVESHSFVGLAFHALNNETFDAVYFRPFRFNDTDEMLRSRSIQYISLPKYTWQELRGKSPGKYEHAIVPASPDPNGWFKVRIEIKDKTITTWVNGSETASLVVDKVTDVKSGSIGFYVADTSGGDFANISITKIN